MSFVIGFLKNTAGEPVAFGAIGGALKKGLSHAGSSTVKSALIGYWSKAHQRSC